MPRQPKWKKKSTLWGRSDDELSEMWERDQTILLLSDKDQARFWSCIEPEEEGKHWVWKGDFEDGQPVFSVKRQLVDARLVSWAIGMRCDVHTYEHASLGCDAEIIEEPVCCVRFEHLSLDIQPYRMYADGRDMAKFFTIRPENTLDPPPNLFGVSRVMVSTRQRVYEAVDEHDVITKVVFVERPSDKGLTTSFKPTTRKSTSQEGNQSVELAVEPMIDGLIAEVRSLDIFSRKGISSTHAMASKTFEQAQRNHQAVKAFDHSIERVQRNLVAINENVSSLGQLLAHLSAQNEAVIKAVEEIQSMASKQPEPETEEPSEEEKFEEKLRTTLAKLFENTFHLAVHEDQRETLVKVFDLAIQNAKAKDGNPIVVFEDWMGSYKEKASSVGLKPTPEGFYFSVNREGSASL